MTVAGEFFGQARKLRIKDRVLNDRRGGSGRRFGLLWRVFLEEEGALLDIFESKFPHSKLLYEDIVKDNKVTAFKNIIYEIYNSPLEEEKPCEDFVSPFVLMDRAGYTLYECHSENERKC